MFGMERMKAKYLHSRVVVKTKARLNIKTVSPGIWISIIQMRRPPDRLIFIMGIFIQESVFCSEKTRRFNIRSPSYQYRNSHCGDKMILWQSYLHNGIPYTGKISLYLISAQGIQRHDHNVSPELRTQFVLCCVLLWFIIRQIYP